MFYDLVLLRRQNQGRFAMAWVAATRGIQTVSREFGLNKIREIDITILCKETMEYLQSTSNNPKERVSLRMAVHLIQGTIIIFNKKVSMFQEDLSKYYTCITTFPKELSLPRRKKDPTQRMFMTPPTPVIKEKGKHKRVSVEPAVGTILEEFLRGTTEPEVTEILPTAAEAPSEVEARKEDLYILQAQPLQVVIPEDMFGDFDVIPTQIVPQKPPSVTSEKSQLEKIEELLLAEQIAESREITERREISKAIEAPPKKSSSSSVDEGPKMIQVEAMVHRHAEEVEPEKEIAEKREIYQKDSSSNGVQEGPAIIVVEAMVHRSAEGEEETLKPVEQPPKELVVPELMEIVEEIQPVKETVSVKEQAKQRETEMEIQTVIEEGTKPKKRPVLRQLQKDEIPTQEVRTPKKLSEEEKQKKENEEKIRKFLRIKFRTARRVLHLDDYEKTKHKEKFPIKIFKEKELLYVDLADFIMGIWKESLEEIPVERMRKEGSTRSLSEVFGRPSKPSTLTPVEPRSERFSEPASLDIISRFNIETIRSTPYREDIAAMPPKKLYEETKIEYELPVPETIHIQKEMLVEVEPVLEQIEKEPEQPRRPSTDRLTPTKKKEEEEKERNIKERIKLWDEGQGYLLVDDLIPLPKNRLNAAKTFHLLLRFVKEGLVNLLPEENSLEVKYVKKGNMLY